MAQTKPVKNLIGYSSPADFQDFVAYDPYELWAEYSPIAMQMPDDYDDYVVVG